MEKEGGSESDVMGAKLSSQTMNDRTFSGTSVLGRGRQVNWGRITKVNCSSYST